MMKVHQHPPTPPAGNPELQYGMQHLVQHSAHVPYGYDEEEYLHPGQHHGSYANPMMQQELNAHLGEHYMIQGYSHPQYPELQDQSRVGLGIAMAGFGAHDAGFYPEDNQNFQSQPYMNTGLRADSPLTPRSTGSDSGRKASNTRSSVKTNSPSRTSASKVMKSKKPKGNKADKPKTPKLTAPLSVLTKDFDDIPVKDMRAWVSRSAEVRRQEVEKRNGYVTRPMNSFMLYRSAYAERTKVWCTQNNHQVVSSVSGESWPMEPPEVREEFNELAKIERMNHQSAHPTYKFSPSKGNTLTKKRKESLSDDEDDDVSDVDDPDGDYGPPGQRRSRTRAARQYEREAGYTSHTVDPFCPSPGQHSALWDTSGQVKPLPVAMMPANPYHPYHQTAIQQGYGAPAVHFEDPRLQSIQAQSGHYNEGASLIGLPGGDHIDLLQLHSQGNTPAAHDGQVDPMLLAYGGNQLGEQALHTNEELAVYELENYGGNGGMPEYQPIAWQADPVVGSMAQSSEFEDQWMDAQR